VALISVSLILSQTPAYTALTYSLLHVTCCGSYYSLPYKLATAHASTAASLVSTWQDHGYGPPYTASASHGVRVHFPALLTLTVRTHRGMARWVDLGDWLHTEMAYPPTDL